MTTSDNKRPTPDAAEHNAFFPPPYSLSQFTSPKSDLSGADYPNPYQGKQKILLIGGDERYLLMKNGTRFSTGNHPIETLLPMYHLDKAGFEFEVATLSGNPVKFEYWAFPNEDDSIKSIHDKYLPQFQRPQKLSDIVANKLSNDADSYIAVFIPGGHAAPIGLPQSTDVKAALNWALDQDRHIITLCHGPAALLAAGEGETKDSYPFNGYKICAFPDSLDAKTPELGYMPGDMPWFMGEKLKALGVKIINDDIKGHTHQDRKLITGDSPFASNKPGQLAAKAPLQEISQQPR